MNRNLEPKNHPSSYLDPEDIMSSIQEEILEGFFKRLEESSGFDGPTIQRIKDLLQSGKKVKAEEMEKILSENDSGTTSDSD